MNLAVAHDHFSVDLLSMVQFLFDGCRVELRFCSVYAINRTA